MKWQRARKPEEKEARRQSILRAARKLTTEVGPVELSLSELARRSGVSKPNIYRYFESREEILLQVWIEEVRELCDRMERAFSSAKSRDVKTTVATIVRAFEAQPRLCELMAIVSSVLEPGLSADAIVRAKLTLSGLTLRLAELLHARLPELGLEECGWASAATGVFVAGLWPPAHPSGAVAEVLARPEFAPMKVHFARDFTRFLEVLFAGLMTREPRKTVAKGR